MSTSKAKHESRHRQREARASLSASEATSSSSSSSASSTCPSATSSSSFGYYDKLYEHVKSTNFASTTRSGSVEVIPPIINNDATIKTNQTYAIIKCITINAFSASQLIDGKPTLIPRGNGGTQIYGDLSGLLLGMHHFNNGIGTVVPRIAGMHERCPIRFALENTYDSESSQAVAVQRFGNEIIDHPDRPPGTLFGAWRSAVSIPLAFMSTAYEVPQISPLSTSTELDDTNQYKYFGRLIPSDAGTALAVVDYLETLGVKHFGMFYVNDSYGSAFHQAILEVAYLSRPEGERLQVKGNPFSYNNNLAPEDVSRDIDLQVQQLARTGYRYFFGVLYDEHYELIMKAAVKYGIVGPGYVWIVSDGLSETFLDGRTYPVGSPLAIASQGIGILKAEGGRKSRNDDDGQLTGYDRFHREWYRQGAENVDYYNCKQPKTNTMDDASIYFKGPHDFFTGKQLEPTAGAVFTYDSVIALGLAACQLYEERDEERGDAYFDGPDLFDAFASQSFEGASGKVIIDPETTSRDPTSAFFVLYNTNGKPDGEGSTVFNVKTVAHSAPNENENSSNVRWLSYNNEKYMYSDGTQYAPDPLPLPEENLNQLTTSVRATGLTVCGLIFALALFFGVWTRRNCKKRVVKASQPEFLYMICFGVVVLGSTLIPLSIDDGVASVEGCDTACISVPWLFNFGFTTAFSGLFVKTRRLNSMMANLARSKKMRVKRRHAMKPYGILLMLNTIVLVIWTEVDPLKWARIDTGAYDNFGRSLESYGTCRSNHIVPYVVLLFIINLSTVILANYQAYRARNLSTEFSESKYISIIMVAIFQTISIGLPLYVFFGTDPTASFVVLTCIIAGICFSTLVLMFAPKMLALKTDETAQCEVVEGENATNDDGVEIERINTTHVKADVDDEDEDGAGGGTFGNSWGDAFRRTGAFLFGGSDDTGAVMDEERGVEGDGSPVMSGKSIFVGTSVHRDHEHGQ